jgi:hypothetical protein
MRACGLAVLLWQPKLSSTSVASAKEVAKAGGPVISIPDS